MSYGASSRRRRVGAEGGNDRKGLASHDRRASTGDNRSGFAWAAIPDADPLSSYVRSISAQLDPRVAPTLAQLEGPGRQLLALRSYLRSGSHLAERWSWTQERIEAFGGSPEQRDLQQEIDRVRTAFVAANPGFELYVNSQVRSLDVQIAHWNSNNSVTAAAEEIAVAVHPLMASPGFPAIGPSRPGGAQGVPVRTQTPADADDRGARSVVARPDASDRLSGASGRAGRRRPQRGHGRHGLGGGGMGGETRRSRAYGEQQIRRPTGISAGAVALHLRARSDGPRLSGGVDGRARGYWAVCCRRYSLRFIAK